MKSLKLTVGTAGALAVGLLAGGTVQVKASPSQVVNPVIVELFTSEGCSSCPPADRLLRQIEKVQPVAGATVIGLEEHVDYWNRLGWRDPFSAGEYSNRQNDYARKFGPDTVYTPEMVVDGQAYCVGSDDESAFAEINRAKAAPKALIDLTAGTSDVLEVHASNIPRGHGKLVVYLAVTESNLVSNPTRGENGGAILIHSAVVRSLREIGNIDNSRHSFNTQAPLKLSPNWKKDRLTFVVFIQDEHSKAIVGAEALAP